MRSDLDDMQESDPGLDEIRDNDQGIADSSPQQPDHDSSPKPSATSRDSSPANSIKSKHHDLLSAKKRRKKPRNIYVTPQKQRLLRLKQKEREENKKKVSLADAIIGDGIQYGSASLDSVNNAFEEDFGPLLRGDKVENVNPLDVAVDLLLGTALGGIGLDRVNAEGGADINKIDITAGGESGDADNTLHAEGDPPPVLTSLLSAKEPSLDAPISSGIKGGSPSCQLLAEAEKDSEKHDHASEDEAADIDSSPETERIMPLMKESVVRVPSRNLFQQIDIEGMPHLRRSVSILSTASRGSKFQAKSPELKPSGLEILDDPEVYLSRPLERRLSLGPDLQLQEHVARGVANVPDHKENEDMVMVDFR